jgi:hypothetical protein
MARTQGNIQLGLNIEPTGQSILDARLWVATLEELYSAYPTKNYYQDMVVTVGDQKSQYMLIDVENVTNASGWKRIDAGAAVETVIVDNLISTRTDAALSANQGKVLKDELDSLGVVKLETPEEGFAASYQLQKNGVALGATINVIKDLVVDSGSVKSVTEADVPYEGAVVGDLYIELVITNGTSLYIPVNQLVDKYEGSDYITVSGANVVSLNYDALKTKLDTDFGITTIASDLDAVETTVGALKGTVAQNTANISTNSTSIANLQTAVSNITNTESPNSLAAKIATLETTVGDEESGLVKDVADAKTALNEIKVKDVDTTSSNGVALQLEEGIVKVNVVPATLASSINSTQVKVGVAITGGAEIGADQTIAQGMQALSDSIQTAVAGGITSLTSPDETITITDTDTGTSRGLAVNISKLVSTSSSIKVGDDGKLDMYWTEAK